MEGTIELKFIRPVGDDITSPGGEFGATRHYGPHKGVDFKSRLRTDVRASERGEVVCSVLREGSKEKQKDYHLHFELIDSLRKLVWDGGNWHPLSLRKDPMNGYIGSTLTIDYDRTGGQISRAGLSSRYEPFYRL